MAEGVVLKCRDYCISKSCFHNLSIGQIGPIGIVSMTHFGFKSMNENNEKD